MKAIKYIICIILILGAFIGGIAITNWNAARKVTDKIKLTKPQEIIVVEQITIINESIEYDLIIEEGEDGEVIIRLKKKGD